MKKFVLASALLALLLAFAGCATAESLPSAVQEAPLPTETVPLAASPALPAVAQPAAPIAPEDPAPTRLTAGEARAIALKHAGIAEDQIRFLRVEFDYDDGVPRYEVEFVAEGWEYEYEIHATTGTVLSFDKDR